MDLYSAARRLSRPFLFTEDNEGVELPIGARGLIGDGHTCALVRVDGAIDWLCLPRFDSPSVFAAILDPDRGGLTSISPADRPFESLQRYDPGTNVLETLYRVPGAGVVRLTDFMPWTDDARASIHEVHRRVECVEGSVELRIVFDPRFGYGKEQPTIERGEHGIVARSSESDNLVAVLEGPCQWAARDKGGMETKIRLRAGQRRWMVLSWDAPQPEPVAAYRPFEHLRATRHRWREWARSLQYEGPWRHHVSRSALALKLMLYAPTGAMVAAPTTSLPEWIGGGRNWDYRYAWSRDTAMAVRACNLIGYRNEARDFFHFVRDALHDIEGLQVLYSVDGTPAPDEEILSHLRGYRHSAPVRIGNAARHQVQLDTAGAVVDAAYLYERSGGSLTLRAWRQMRQVVDAVCQQWNLPDHGIWEPRVDPRHNVHSRLMSWLALDRGSRLAPLFSALEAQARWRRSADEVHADVLAHGMDRKRRHFVAGFDNEEPDASLLLLPIHQFLDARDPRMIETVDWVRRELSDGPFIYRYHAHVDADGLHGKEGAFILCGFWLAEALALAGKLEEAQDVFVAHAEASNHLGLLSEEIDPGNNELIGNFPQAFSHLGLINAATRIDLALRLRDEGSQAVPHFLDRVALRDHL